VPAREVLNMNRTMRAKELLEALIDWTTVLVLVSASLTVALWMV